MNLLIHEKKRVFMSRNYFNFVEGNMALVLSIIGLVAGIFGLFFGYNVGRDIAINQNEKEAALRHQQEQQQIPQKNHPK
jgi:hypothetical protein